MQPTVCTCLVKGERKLMTLICRIRQMNSFKKSVIHNNSCMYYAVHKYFRGLVATNIIMSFIKYYCSGILKDNLPN